MKKQTVAVLVDCEYLQAHPNKMDLVGMLIEFGAPITIDESEKEPINIEGSLEYTFLNVSDQNAYSWTKEVEDDKPSRIVAWIRVNGPPIISVDGKEGRIIANEQEAKEKGT